MDGLASPHTVHLLLGLCVTNEPYVRLDIQPGFIFCLHISKCGKCLLTRMEVSSEKKGQHLYCYRDCVTRGPIHRQARVNFHNFAEVNWRDFLLTIFNNLR